jgi:hypothetical protein
LAGAIDDRPGVCRLRVLGIRSPSKRAHLPANVHRDAHCFQPLTQARVEQRAWTVLLTGCIRTGARQGLYERDRPHQHIISQTAGRSTPHPAANQARQRRCGRLLGVEKRLDCVDAEGTREQEALSVVAVFALQCL